MIGYRERPGKTSYWAATYANGRPTGQIYRAPDSKPLTHDFWVADGKEGKKEAEKAFAACTEIDDDGFLQVRYHPNPRHYVYGVDGEADDEQC